MKNIKFLVCIILALALLVSCAPANAPAVSDMAKDKLGQSEVIKLGVSILGERIRVQKDPFGEGYTLYLPSYYSGLVWSVETDGFSISGKAIKDGESASEVLSADSITLEKDGKTETVKVMRSENIPALFIDTEDGTMEKINASPDHSYSSKGDYLLVSESGEELGGGALKKVRGRGNSTWYGTDKKPYQIDMEEPVSLLGLAKAKKYVLLANYYDPSLLRNRVALKIAELADTGYAPKCEPIDLFACGEYLGSYLLCEKIDIDDTRIDIADLEGATEDINSEDLDSYERRGDIEGAAPGSAKWFDIPNDPDDVTGGYLLEADYPERYPDEVSGFVTERGLPIVIKTPEYVSEAQVKYISEFVCDFEDALYSESGYNDKGKHYSDYADIESLVFKYLLEEFALNIDGGISSFYMYKDTEANGGKLNFSCAWDYDCGFGNYKQYADLTQPDAMFVASNERRNNQSMPSWFYAMMQRPEIKEKVSSYYKETFRDILLSVSGSLAGFAEEIEASALMDFNLYEGYEKRDFFGVNTGDTYEESAKYLANFIEKRIDHFDTIFGG